MATKNVIAPREPLIKADNLQQQLSGLTHESVEWLRFHWLQILIAFAVGAAIVLALHAARRLGARGDPGRDRAPHPVRTLCG